eukprot:jgi/Chlat1/8555/Chrsp82S07951
MGTSWFTQFRAAMQRNVLVKRRLAKATVQEVLLPIYFVMLLILLKLMTQEVDVPAVEQGPTVDAFCRPVSSCWEWPYGSHFATSVIGYVPGNNPYVTSTMTQALLIMQQQYPYLYPYTQTPEARPFDSEDELLRFYNDNPEVLYAGVVFSGVTGDQQLPADLTYTIRMNASYVPNTHSTRSSGDSCRPEMYGYLPPTSCESQRYLTSGFVSLQHSVAQALLPPVGSCAQLHTDPIWPSDPNTPAVVIEAQAGPLDAFRQSFASKRFRLFVSMYMVWATLPLMQVSVTHLVHEKESLIKDCMLAMGLKESVFWLAWFTTYAGMSAMTSAILAVTTHFLGLFTNSSTLALFLVFFPYCLSVVTLSFAMSTVFSRARVAGRVGGIVGFLASLVIVPLTLSNASAVSYAFLALFSPIGLAIAMDVVTQAEASGSGIHFNNFWASSPENLSGVGRYPLSLGAVVLFFCLDAILYAMLAWYLDNVFPHPQRGPSQKDLFFCFRRAFWFPKRPKYYLAAAESLLPHHLDEADPENGEGGATSDVEVDDIGAFATSGRDGEIFEPIGQELASRCKVAAMSLRKAYGSSLLWYRGLSHLADTRKKVAVKGLDLVFLEGQVCALLGHAGSGKSTVLSMLSGVSSASSGDANIYGHRLSNEASTLRAASWLGYCPQTNIALQGLSPREQITFFASMKGPLRLPQGAARGAPGPASETGRGTPEQMANAMLAEAGLEHCAHKMPSELSASELRMLSLCLALVGDPAVVLLDEPTSGMDPVYSARLWDILARRKASGRVIIITTSAMDEADDLADRKVIMSHGVVRCCGSSAFLKQKFGLGYSLLVSKTPRFDGPAVLHIIQEAFPTASLVKGGSQGQAENPEAVYELPLGAEPKLADLLFTLHDQGEQLGIGEMALEATTLEDVFMQLQAEPESDVAALPLSATGEGRSKEEQEGLLGELVEQGQETRALEGAAAAVGQVPARMQLRALLSLRKALYVRSPLNTFATFAVPLIIILTVLILQSSLVGWTTARPSMLLWDSSVAHERPLIISTDDEASAHMSDVSGLLSSLGPELITTGSSAMPISLDDSYAGPLVFNRLNLGGCRADVKIEYDPLQMHELPTMVAMVDDAILGAAYASILNGTRPNIRVASHPLPDTGDIDILGYLVAFFVSFALLLIPAILAARVSEERPSTTLHVMQVSSLHRLAYFGSMFIADCVALGIFLLLVMLLGYAFGHQPFTLSALPILVTLLGVATPTLILLAYVASFWHPDPSTTAANLLIVFFLAALIPWMFMLGFEDGALDFFHVPMAIIDPPYALKSGIFWISDFTYGYSRAHAGATNVPAYEYFMWSRHVLPCILGMAACCGLLLWRLKLRPFAVTSKFVQDWGAHDTEPGTEAASNGSAAALPNEDEDVALERERLRKGVVAGRWAGAIPEENLIFIKNLKAERIVENAGLVRFRLQVLQGVWLGVSRGEVVGLLGTNNSGKSAMLQCLVGAMVPSGGEAHITTYTAHAETGGGHARRRVSVGFCPQEGGLWSELTPREHLRMFAAIKGLPQASAVQLSDGSTISDGAGHAHIVEDAIALLNMAAHADIRVGDCPVSIQRKLAVALALLGAPDVLLLDEPTKGLDVASRQAVWDAIRKVAVDRAVILCTHSMEEADSVCTRIGILVRGQLKALGTSQHLKRKYGSSYALQLRAGQSSRRPANWEGVHTLVTEVFPTAIVDEGSLSTPHQRNYTLPVRDLRGVGVLIKELEGNKDALGIEWYSVSQPSLQQVFLQLNREDTPFFMPPPPAYIEMGPTAAASSSQTAPPPN